MGRQSAGTISLSTCFYVHVCVCVRVCLSLSLCMHGTIRLIVLAMLFAVQKCCGLCCIYPSFVHSFVQSRDSCVKHGNKPTWEETKTVPNVGVTCLL